MTTRSTSTSITLEATSEPRPAELSFSQRRLWFLDQIDPGGAAYVMAKALEMRGVIDVPMLERALGGLFSRHESLRTVFVNLNGHPMQVVSEPGALTLPVTDLSGQSDQQLAQRMREEAARGFDLARGPLFRAQLYRLDADTHVLQLTLHHIISDGWSTQVLLRELGGLYEAFCAGRPSPLAELPIQYADFAAWQREWLQGEVLETQLGYWEEQLKGAPALLELPTKGPRPALQSHRGATETAVFPRSLLTRLKALSRAEGASLFMTLLAAYQTLLGRYSGQEDILVGSPIAGRNRREVEGLIGFFVNMLVLRGDLSGNPTFRELLGRVREVALAAYAHQDLPFERLVEELQPERNLSYNPLFQISFALENTPEPARLGALKTSWGAVSSGTSKFDLSVEMTEGPEGLATAVEYCTDLFDREMIQRLLGHFRVLLEGIVADPDRRIMALPLLTEPERHQLLVEWNDTATVYPKKDMCLHHLIEEQTRRTPDQVAMVFEQQTLTYGELNRRANQLAHRLRGMGVGPDVLVALFVERSLEMLVGIVGVLKAGGAYVPIDPAYPKERLEYILEESKAPIVLTQESLVDGLPRFAGQSICLDAGWAEIAREPAENLVTQVRPEDLAYVLFTSGSTGRPKGVALEHRSAATFVQWAKQVFTPQELAAVLFSTSVCFDLSVFEIFVTLSAGGKVIVARNALHLPNLPEKDEVTLINTVPSAIAELLRMGAVPASVKTVNLAGEALLDTLVERIYANTKVDKVYNLYGPTETTTYSTYTLVRRGCPVTIGRSIADTQCYILDGSRNPVPIGVMGELYIAGAGLARGYFARPELTNERFVPNPFGRESGERMYRTGDLCHWLPDGNIQYEGRTDHQIKLRGFRIELGEIEASIARHPTVREVVVLAREDTPGDKRLVAYVVADNPPADLVDQLRTLLRATLPEYMVPAQFVRLDSLPLTPNGKVDRKALPAPDRSTGLEISCVAPRTPTEEILAGIWAQILGFEKVGVEDNFFDLGGNSMMFVRMLSEINRRHQVSLGPAELFRNPTVGQIAKLIDGTPPKRKRQPAVVQLQEGRAELPVYFIHAGPIEFRLAKALGEKHTVFGIDVPWPLAWRNAVAANRTSGFPTMEQMAAPYAAALGTHTPSSPCVLAGHSFAGLMAFEVAHQFVRQGGKVEMVILLDTWARDPAPQEVAWHQWRREWKEAPERPSTDRLAQSIASRLRNSWRITRWLLGQEVFRVWPFLRRFRMNQDDLMPVLDEEGMPLRWGILDRAYRKILESYRPRPLESRGVLFRTDGNTVLRGFDDSQGWNNLFSRGLEIVPVIGDHISIVLEHHPMLARQINEVLQRHWSNQASKVSIDAHERRRAPRAPQTGAIASVVLPGPMT